MESLKIITQEDSQALTIRFCGQIDEDTQFRKIKIGSHKNIVIDMGELTSINSCGCRDWVKWIAALAPDTTVRFTNCPTVFIDHVNLIDGFLPKKGAIDSFNIPYYCEKCDHLMQKKIESDQLPMKADKVSEFVACDKCGGQAELDVIPSTFFRFLKKVPG